MPFGLQAPDNAAGPNVVSGPNVVTGPDRPGADVAGATGAGYAVGIIGTGFNAREHARRLSQLPDAVLRCVYDIEGGKAARFAAI